MRFLLCCQKYKFWNMKFIFKKTIFWLIHIFIYQIPLKYYCNFSQNYLHWLFQGFLFSFHFKPVVQPVLLTTVNNTSYCVLIILHHCAHECYQIKMCIRDRPRPIHSYSTHFPFYIHDNFLLLLFIIHSYYLWLYIICD